MIKDNIATHPNLEMTMSAGNLALRDSRPKRSAKIVDKVCRRHSIELPYLMGVSVDRSWLDHTREGELECKFSYDPSLFVQDPPRRCRIGSMRAPFCGHPVSH